MEDLFGGEDPSLRYLFNELLIEFELSEKRKEKQQQNFAQQLFSLWFNLSILVSKSIINFLWYIEYARTC